MCPEVVLVQEAVTPVFLPTSQNLLASLLRTHSPLSTLGVSVQEQIPLYCSCVSSSLYVSCFKSAIMGVPVMAQQ